MSGCFLKDSGFCRIICNPGCAKSAQFLSAYNPDQQFRLPQNTCRSHGVGGRGGCGEGSEKERKKEMVECLEKLANYFFWLIGG